MVKRICVSMSVCNMFRHCLSYFLLFGFISCHKHSKYHHYVKVLHYIVVPTWGESRSGMQYCGNIACDWVHSDRVDLLKENLMKTNHVSHHGLPTTTLSLYNMHSWWQKVRGISPDTCELSTNYTMAESEESRVRYGQLYEKALENFDATSSTHTDSNLQRAYAEANFTHSDLQLLRSYSTLIKAGSYVASDCHRSKFDHANSNRDGIVAEIRNAGFRIDGLGNCMHSIGPEGIELSNTKDPVQRLRMKREVIGHFMFNMAFENSIEPGYVTEKPFDALFSGTVPVYLGDATHLKSLLPHPKAAIFVADFPNTTALAHYLIYLTKNETAYEEHRSWRLQYNHAEHIRNKPLLKDSWFCRVCQWAVNQTITEQLGGIVRHAKRITCTPSVQTDTTPTTVQSESSVGILKVPIEYEGKALRSNSARQVYLVKNSTLHAIPDLATFNSIQGLDLEKTIVLEGNIVDSFIKGDPVKRVD